MNSKFFKVGDVVVGNKQASDHYRITVEGFVGVVIDTKANSFIIRGGTHQHEVMYEYFDYYQNAVGANETADVKEVVHGKWLESGDLYNSIRCSLCDGKALKHFYLKDNQVASDYCPHCGADMREN